MLALAIGVVLLLRAEHGDVHTHAVLEHEHGHIHDVHHEHAHSPSDPTGDHMRTHIGTTPSRIATPTALTYTTDTGTSAVLERRSG